MADVVCHLVAADMQHAPSCFRVPYGFIGFNIGQYRSPFYGIAYFLMPSSNNAFGHGIA